MNLENLIKQLNEERKNPSLNPKISAYESLKPYSDKENYYISFTEIDKIGINPRSKYDTPLGIYTYPIKQIWKEYEIDKYKRLKGAIPFAGGSPYIWVIKPKSNKNVLHMDTYTDEQYQRDKYRLWRDRANNPNNYKYPLSRSIFDANVKTYEDNARFQTPMGKLWNVTRNIAYNQRKGKGNVQWNAVLRKVLKYDGMTDSGNKYIHKFEPIQAVFFSTSSFSVVTKVFNKDYGKGYEPKPDWLVL